MRGGFIRKELVSLCDLSFPHDTTHSVGLLSDHSCLFQWSGTVQTSPGILHLSYM